MPAPARLAAFRTRTLGLATLAALVVGAGVAGCRPQTAGARDYLSDAEILQTAMGELTNVMVYDIMSPPQASRAYAYASVAAYEAMRPAFPAYRTLAGQVNELAPLPAPPAGVRLSFPLAGVHAFMAVGRALTFSRPRMDSLRAALDERFRARGMADDEFARSTAYGDTIAARVLAWAGKDHFLQTRGAPKFSVVTADPGRWVPTPPAYMDAVEPNWGKLRPFVLDSAGQFRPEPPYRFDTTRASPFYREMLEVYNIGKHLTDEQKAQAAFWDCNPYVMHVQGHTMFATKKISPGGHWMGIATIAARRTHADVMRTAAAYARTSMALADGFIRAWDEKYRTNMIRPETVINRYVDGAWEPFLQTPPFPDYLSGHSTISAAAAAVLTDEFGARFAYADSSEVPYGLPVRRYASFAQAAQEAAASRLYAGIHYRRANEQGTRVGAEIGALHVQRVRPRGAEAQVAQQASAGR